MAKIINMSPATVKRNIQKYRCAETHWFQKNRLLGGDRLIMAIDRLTKTVCSVLNPAVQAAHAFILCQKCDRLGKGTEIGYG